MAELSCPVCSADVPMSGEERPGEELFCSYCGAPLVLRGASEADYALEDAG